MKKGIGVVMMVMAWISGIVTESKGQEFRAEIEVNSQQIEGTNKSVFETLQEAMKDYFNETRFSNYTFANNERIDCRLFFTIKEYDGQRMKGDLQVQLSRPVYNASYTTTVFNFKDNKIEFDYSEGDPLIYNENSWDSNLRAILDYYAYLLLGLDFDTFSPQGGQEFFERAASVVQAAQSSGETGWKTFEDTKNRSAVLTAFTETSGGAMRRLLYDYYRKGLDEMVTSPDKGRAALHQSLKELQGVYKAAPMSVALSIFRDSKMDELVNVYSKAPATEREEAYEILQPMYPTDIERLEKIKKGDESNN